MAPLGPFDPPIGRQSSVVVLSRRFNDSWGDYRLVTTISTRSSTEVLEINSSSGELLIAADHSFTDEASALAHLSRQGFTELARGASLLGYTATETLAGVLLATRVTTKAVLPGGHAVALVTDARWELLQLDRVPASPASAAAEQEFWRSMQQHSVGGVHYFCETADLTRPFPSAAPSGAPNPEFVWNAWLAQPLADIGLKGHCPVLLQGGVEAGDEVHPTGQRYTLCLLSRRSRRHPGTRYNARGLNDLAGPGNEIEAELLMWTPSAGGSGRAAAAVRWARVVWRRGTVPIWWGVELQPLNKGLQAEVYVKEEGTYVGMLTYFRDLQRLAAAEAGLSGVSRSSSGGRSSGDAPQDATPTYESDGGSGDGEQPHQLVTCVNLLHCDPKKASELMLYTHYKEGMDHVRKRMRSGGSGSGGGATPPALINFDWHGVMAILKEDRAIPAYWTFIEPHVKGAGLAMGVMEPAEGAGGGGSGGGDDEGDVTPWGDDRWRMRWLQRQRGLLRFNCADSLDRTGAATCFAALPALQEGLRLLGIPLDITAAPAAALLATKSPLRASATALSASASAGALGGAAAAPAAAAADSDIEEGEEEDVLPEGWEVKLTGDGKKFYVDHNNRKTQWDPPPGTKVVARGPRPRTTSAASLAPSASASSLPGTLEDSVSLDSPWAFFSLSLDDVRSRLFPDAIADVVGMFRRNGDVHSALYTGSPAMHSHVLGLVLAAEARPYAASSHVGKLQNLRVAVQRRWNNTVSDSARQQSVELFLGLNVDRHCPGLWLAAPRGPAADLAGPDADDTAAGDAAAVGPAARALGAELEALHLTKHDGRLGLQEDLRNLEPLAPAETGGAAGGTPEDAEEEEEEEEEEALESANIQALDPLGAVLISTAQQPSSGGGGGGGNSSGAPFQESLI